MQLTFHFVSGISKKNKQQNKTMELPNPGSYRAKQNGTVLIIQEESGSLMAYVPYALVNAAVSFSGHHALCLGSKDGTGQKKNIQTLKTIFPSWDVDSFADIEMPAEGEEVPQFELADCYHDDSYVPEGAEAAVVQFKAKWLNPIGGGIRKQPMDEAQRKAAKTKWASKFKALLATAPATTAKTATAPAKSAPAKAAPAKAAVSGPPGRKTTAATPRTSTQEEVWEALVAANEDKSDDEKAQLYYDACDSVVEGSSADPSLIDSPAKWGKVAEALGV